MTLLRARSLPAAAAALLALPLLLAPPLPAERPSVAMAPSVPVAAVTEVYPRPTSGVYEVAGHGWGHARGMSQVGAEGAARVAGLDHTRILDFYYPGLTRVVEPDRTIRVELRGDTDSDSVVLDTGDLSATNLTGTTPTSGTPGAPVALVAPAPGGQWGVVPNDTGLHVLWRPGDGRPWVNSTDAMAGQVGRVTTVRLSSAAGSATVVLPGGTRRTYPGSVLGLTDRGHVTVVEVSRESYLRGVVPGEMSPSSAQEALRSQAVAARTYATWRMESPRRTWAHAHDNTDDQVYPGAVHHASTDQAVAATTGTVLRTSGGAAAFTQFSASNGGWSVSGGQAYLPAQRDDFDGLTGTTSHAWSARLPVSALQAMLPAGATFTQLEVTGRDGNGDWGGRVTTAVVVGRTAAGAEVRVQTTGAGVYASQRWPGISTGLRSTWWRVTSAPPSPPTDVRAVAQDGSATVTWAPPATSGSFPVTRYTVLAQPGPAGAVVDATVRSVGLTGLTNGQAYTFTVTASTDGGTSSTASTTGAVTPTWTPGGFVPLDPARVYDSRDAGGPLGAGETRVVGVAGAAGVPATATAVALTVTAAGPTAGSFLTVFPHGWPRPTASSLNVGAGTDRANAVVARLGSGGAVAVYNERGRTDVVVDVVGYWSASATSPAALVTSTPGRVYDSREAGGALSPGVPRDVVVTGVGPAPTGATAVVLNVTAVTPDRPTYLSVRPGRDGLGRTSSLNLRAGETLASAVVVGVTPGPGGGTVSVLSGSATTDVVVDVLGWLVPSAAPAGRVAAISPQRVLDTRVTKAPLGPRGSVRVPVLGTPGVPSTGVRAVLVNVTGIAPTAGTFLRVDAGSGGTSTLNLAPGDVVANLALVPVAPDGSITVYNDQGRAEVALDVVGFVTG